MRRSIFVSLGLVALLGGTAVAAPSGPGPAPAPSHRLPPVNKLRVDSIARVLADGTPATPALAETGPVEYQLTVVNDGDQPVTVPFTADRTTPIPGVVLNLTKTSLTIAAHGQAKVHVTDGQGRYEMCGALTYRFAVGEHARTAKLVPSCTFALTPGTLGGAPANHLHVVTPELTSSTLACNGTLGVRAKLKNDASVAVTQAHLYLDGPHGGPSTSVGGLAPGETSGWIAATYPAFVGGTPSTYTLKIFFPPNSGNTASIHQPGWSVNVQRTCTAVVFLDPA